MRLLIPLEAFILANLCHHRYKVKSYPFDGLEKMTRGGKGF